MVLGEVCNWLRMRVWPKHHTWFEGEFEYYAGGRVFEWIATFESMDDLRRGLIDGIALKEGREATARFNPPLPREFQKGGRMYLGRP